MSCAGPSILRCSSVTLSAEAAAVLAVGSLGDGGGSAGRAAVVAVAAAVSGSGEVGEGNFSFQSSAKGSLSRDLWTHEAYACLAPGSARQNETDLVAVGSQRIRQCPTGYSASLIGRNGCTMTFGCDERPRMRCDIGSAWSFGPGLAEGVMAHDLGLVGLGPEMCDDAIGKGSTARGWFDGIALTLVVLHIVISFGNEDG